MSYLGNLTCGDCGLTFTSRWGAESRADEYRCEGDHVALVHPDTGLLLSLESAPVVDLTLADLRGLCPICSTEMVAGRLPSCPVCGGREHEVTVAGTI
jgi:hypothetical protein